MRAFNEIDQCKPAFCDECRNLSIVQHLLLETSFPLASARALVKIYSIVVINQFNSDCYILIKNQINVVCCL